MLAQARDFVDKRMSRRWQLLACACLALFILFFFAAPSPPTESAADVTMQVEPGFGGHFKSGAWLPLRITLTNNGPSVHAEVRAETVVSGRPTAYVAPIELPGGEGKSLTLYVQPSASASTIRVRLVQGQRELASRTVTAILEPYANYLIGVIAPRANLFAPSDKVVLNYLPVRVEPSNELRTPDARPVKVLSITLSDIPGRVESLLTLDALFISGMDTRDLSAEQGRTLQAWVDGGGRLILGGGANAPRTLAGLPEVLVKDFEPLGNAVELASLQALGQFSGKEAPAPGLFAAVLPGGGEVLIEQDKQPLLVEKHFGRGRVDYSSFDLAASEFGAWLGWSPFWEMLLTPRSTSSGGIQRYISPQPEESTVLYALQNLPEPPSQPVDWLMGLILLFILLAGPVNYLVLHRAGRLAWSWFTIPALGFAFAAFALWLGNDMLGDVTLRQISIVNLNPRADAPMSTYVTLSASKPATYTLTMPNDALVGQITLKGLFDPPFAWDVPVEVLQGDRLQVRGAQSNPRSLQAFRVESPLPVGWGIETKLALEGDRLRGTIVNHTSGVIRDAVFVDGDRSARLGDLLPGQPRTVDQVLGARADNGGEALSEIERLRSQLLSEYHYGHGKLSSLPITLELIGWTDISPLSVQVQDALASNRQMSLVIAQVDVQDFAGPIYITPRAVSSHLVDLQGDGDVCGQTASLNVNLGSAVLDFELPEEIIPLRWTRLVLTRHGTLATELEAQDRNRGWVKLESPNPGYYDLPDPARFILPGYIFRLKVLGVKGIPACDNYELYAEGER